MLALKLVDTLSAPTTYAAQETHNTVNKCTEWQYNIMTTFKYAIIKLVLYNLLQLKTC